MSHYCQKIVETKIELRDGVLAWLRTLDQGDENVVNAVGSVETAIADLEILREQLDNEAELLEQEARS